MAQTTEVYLNVNTNELVCYDKKTKTMEAEDTSFQVEPWAFMLFTAPFLVKIGVL